MKFVYRGVCYVKAFYFVFYQTFIIIKEENELCEHPNAVIYVHVNYVFSIFFLLINTMWFDRFELKFGEKNVNVISQQVINWHLQQLVNVMF